MMMLAGGHPALTKSNDRPLLEVSRETIRSAPGQSAQVYTSLPQHNFADRSGDCQISCNHREHILCICIFRHSLAWHLFSSARDGLTSTTGAIIVLAKPKPQQGVREIQAAPVVRQTPNACGLLP